MDAINHFKMVVTYLDLVRFCGRRWWFGGSLTPSAANKARPDIERGCVYVFLTDLAYGTTRTYGDMPRPRDKRITTTFNLYIMMEDELGRNNDNEIPHHIGPTSRWDAILNPLRLCLDQTIEFNGEVLADCMLIKDIFRITNQRMTPEILWQDENYTGWRLSMSVEYQGDKAPESTWPFPVRTQTANFTGNVDFIVPPEYAYGGKRYTVKIVNGKGTADLPLLATYKVEPMPSEYYQAVDQFGQTIVLPL